MDGVAVGLDTGEHDRSMFVSDSFRGAHASGTFGDGLVVDTCGIVDSESDILDAVSVLVVVGRELRMVRVEG